MHHRSRQHFHSNFPSSEEIMRRRKWIPAPSRPSYYSSRHSDEDGQDFISTRLPTILIVGFFLAGLFLGKNDFTRTMAVKFTVLSSEVIQSTWDEVLILVGLAVHKECITDDGVENVAFCSVSQLMGKLMRERVALRKKMESMEEYGQYYTQIFSDANTKPVVASDQLIQRFNRVKKADPGSPLFLLTSSLVKRQLIRRILIKHMQAVIREKTVNDLPPPTFTFVTAGDATAAGHGNLFSQSYTAILQDTVESAFASLGIQFIAKNYGMGQYSSGPELSLCMNEVFGLDIDVLMWDFASLQPKYEHVRRTVLWTNRAGMHPTRPILFSFDAFGERFLKIKEFDGITGTGAILMQSEAMQRLKLTLPDSNAVSDPEKLPAALRYYHCDGTIEGAIRCEDPMRNFVCDLEDDMLDEKEINDGSANPKICRKEKFQTKPQW